MTFRVAIVGGGLAGLACAEALSQIRQSERSSMQIVLMESRRRCGGRTGSFVDRSSESTVDYCQHVAMGCCTNFIDFVDRLGMSEHFRRDDRLTFLHPHHGASRMRPSRWLPPPLQLLPDFARLRFLSVRQKFLVLRATLAMMRTPATRLAGITAENWLRNHGQDDATLADYWDVFLVSALGERTERVSAAAARQVMVEGFAAHRHASRLWIPKRPLAELFGETAVEAIQQRGIEVRTGVTVERIDHAEASFILHDHHNHTETFDAVVVAIPWHSLGHLRWSSGGDAAVDTPPIHDPQRVTQIPVSPITGIHLWFDRTFTTLPHAVLVGTTAQWMFNDPTDSCIDQTSAKSQHYVQVVISASASERTWSTERLIKTVLAELRQVFPAARDARLVRHRVVTDPNAVFSIRSKVDKRRPTTATDWPGLYLAGDWVQTGWPATMESAVRSGRMAANEVAERLGTDAIPLTPDLPLGPLANFLIRRSST